MTGGATAVFFHPDRPSPEELAAVDPDRDPQAFYCGEDIWILQTWMRLARAGDGVELTADLPPPGKAGRIVVYYAGHRPAMSRALRRRGDSRDLVLVAVRGDRHPVHQADFEIVQNRATAGGRRLYVPHWPQPALVPRDPARGERVEVVAFKGFASNLEPSFRDEGWQRSLEEEGFELRFDAVAYEDSRAGAAYPPWHDYRDVDVALAVRPPDPGLHPRKPGTKLYNAWRAGVPALLGAEIGFRELRRSPLDYLEVTSAPEALAALRRLRDEEGLYRRMVEHGLRRGEEFSEAAILGAWREALERITETWRRRNAPVRLADAVRRRLRTILH